MEPVSGYLVGLFVNKVALTPTPSTFSFTISDSIYSPFPKLELGYQDGSGIFQEFGNFTQGVPLNTKLGIASLNELFDVDFRSTRRDNTGCVMGTPGLNGNLLIQGTHESFFINRAAPNKAFKKIRVSEIVNNLFASELKLTVEGTDGNVEVYAVDDPYSFTKNVLLPQASNGKIKPYVFFRNLLNELHFTSIEFLEKGATAEKISFGEVVEDTAYNVANSVLPFNEGLEKVLINFHANGRSLTSSLTLEEADKTVAENAVNKIPVLVNTRIANNRYFNRQFNPHVDYSKLRNAYWADSMKSGFFVDKAMVSLPLHVNLVSGKNIDLTVGLTGSESKIELSETFSGKWLIEQSYHTWDCAAVMGTTQLIVCRSSMKPRNDSIILDKAFN